MNGRRSKSLSRVIVSAAGIAVFLLSSCSDDGASSPNEPPTRPVNPTPADGAVAQAAQLTLKWSSTDADGDVIFFDVLLDTINPPVEHQPQVRATTEIEIRVSQGRRYYWRVVAFDTTGESRTGPVWSFETGIFNTGWSFRASMARARIGAMGAAAQGKIYVFGGFGGELPGQSSEEYDPQSDSWRFVNDIPTPRQYGVAIEHHGYIYTLGGVASSIPRNTVERYDPATDSWSSLSPMPTARSRFAADVYHGQIYVFGGFENHRPILKYDITSDEWSVVDSLPVARNGFSATVLDDKFYLVAGSTPSQFWLDQTDSYDPNTQRFIRLAPMPSIRRDHRGVAIAGKLYVTGGFNSITLHKFFGAIEEFDPEAGRWRTKNEMMIPRHDHVAVALNGLIYCIGGYKEESPNDERTVEVYDPKVDP